MKKARLRLMVHGAVQGVGFRPFVWSLAHRRRLHGWVRNRSSGVEIAVEGAEDDVGSFIEALRAEAPPLARLERVEVRDRAPEGHERFEIIPSRTERLARLVAPSAVCTMQGQST